jgi:hypothetical protein
MSNKSDMTLTNKWVRLESKNNHKRYVMHLIIDMYSLQISLVSFL